MAGWILPVLAFVSARHRARRRTPASRSAGRHPAATDRGRIAGASGAARRPEAAAAGALQASTRGADARAGSARRAARRAARARALSSGRASSSVSGVVLDSSRCARRRGRLIVAAWFPSPVVARLPGAAIASSSLPFWFSRQGARRRVRKFEEQFPEALDLCRARFAPATRSRPAWGWWPTRCRTRSARSSGSASTSRTSACR